MGKSQSPYKVLVFPGSMTSEPRRFSVRKGAVKFLALSSVIFIFAVSVLSFQHYQLREQLLVLNDLRKENKTQKIQIQSFSNTVENLKEQVVRLVEFDQKLRVLTDIGPAKGSTQAFGIGGSEDQRPTFAPPDITASIKQDLDLLQAKVEDQEQSFQELEEVVHSRRSLWASTPSIWPTAGWLSSRFGKRVSPFTGHLKMHQGIDVAARHGTPIIAPAAGVVSYYRFNGGFGRYLKLDHGFGTVTHYGHLSKAAVKVGQKVKRGDVIAYVGNTGLSTGPHLHYEVTVNKISVDPMKYILN